MKKLNTVFRLFCLLLLALPAWAQDPAVQVRQDPAVDVDPRGGQHGSFHFGVTTAVNNTWVKFDNEEQNNEHYKYNTTFKWAPIGVALGYKFNDRHDLQAEAYLSNQGQTYELVARGDGTGPTIGEKRIDLTYLQVPLLWKFTTGDATRFNVHIGPQFGFLIKGEEVNEITASGGVNRNGSAIPTGTTIMARKEAGEPLDERYGGLNAVDPYIVLGFGLEKDITDNLFLSGNLRFNYGFKDFRDTESVTDPTTGDKYILRYNIFGGLQLGLHYIFIKP